MLGSHPCSSSGTLLLLLQLNAASTGVVYDISVWTDLTNDEFKALQTSGKVIFRGVFLVLIFFPLDFSIFRFFLLEKENNDFSFFFTFHFYFLSRHLPRLEPTTAVAVATAPAVSSLCL